MAAAVPRAPFASRLVSDVAATFEDAFTEWRGNGSPDIPSGFDESIEYAMAGRLTAPDGQAIARLGRIIRAAQDVERLASDDGGAS